MDWGTLAPTALGGLLALGGGFFGQWWSERRTVEREQRAWAREDVHRTFDDRREIYVAYYTLLKASARMVYNASMELGSIEDEWQMPLFDSLNRLRLFAGPRVDLVAGDAYNALWQWGHRVHQVQRGEVVVPRDPHGLLDDAQAYRLEERYDELEVQLLKAIRHELRIP